MKLVSVILPVFNERLDYLEECITSILNQSYKIFELIVVDDSIDEKVIDYLKSIIGKESRIVYRHNEKRLGFVKSLNKGLSLAKGDYIARADSDDIQKVDRFKLQVAFLEANKDIGIVGSSLEKIGENGEKKGIRYYPSTPESVKKKMVVKNTIAHGSVMMRREVVYMLGGYNEEFEKAEDYELWMRAIRKGIKIANIPEPLIKYRISNSIKRDAVNWQNNLKVKLKFFGFDYLGYRIVGILVVSVMLVLPKFLKRLLYTIYNKII